MHSVATGVHLSGDHHHVSNFERSDLFIVDRRDELLFVTGQPEALPRSHSLLGLVFIAIEPSLDPAGLRIKHHAEPAERPAVIRDRHEEACRKPIERADLAPDQSHAAAESHCPDVQRVSGIHYVIFKRRELRIPIRIVERSEELLLSMLITGRAIAAYAHANRAGAAALALSLPHGVQYALAHAVQIAARAPKMRKLSRNRVLNVLVLAPAAFQQQFNLDFVVVLPLMEVNDRGAWPEVIAGVCAGDRIDRVGPQLSATCSFGDGFANLALHHDLACTDGRLDLEGWHSGVLANRAIVIASHVDVRCDH